MDDQPDGSGCRQDKKVAKTITENIKKMKKVFYHSIVILFITVSCQKLKDPGATSAVKLANEWWVTLDSSQAQDYFGIGHFKIATYNTAANDDFIWVDDFKNGYGFKIKSVADFNALTFQSDSAMINDYYVAGSTAAPERVRISDGKVFLKSGHSRSGNVVDSIHFKIEFSDAPGAVYQINGVERSKFPEDDY